MSLDGVNGFLDVESAALRAPQVGIANTNPQHILSVGSNLYVSGDSSDVLTVDGNVVCEGVKVGLIEIIPSYDLEAVANVGNSTSNTILFTNPDTGIVATGNVSVGKTLTVDGIRITAAAEADVDLNAVVAAGPSTARSIQLTGATDSISPYTGTLTIGTNTDNFGGLGVAGNVHVGRGLYVRSNLEVGTANLFVNTVNSRVGIGKTNPDATLDVDGDAIIRGDLSVLGTTTTIDTENLRVQDPIIELGKDNAGTGDLGLIMTRPTGSSNVAIIFDENADTLEIGYTDNDASATDITMVSTPLSVNINGDLSITSNVHAANVGIGTSTPEATLHVEGNAYVSSNLAVSGSKFTYDNTNTTVFTGTATAAANEIGYLDMSTSSDSNNIHVKVYIKYGRSTDVGAAEYSFYIRPNAANVSLIYDYRNKSGPITPVVYRTNATDLYSGGTPGVVRFGYSIADSQNVIWCVEVQQRSGNVTFYPTNTGSAMVTTDLVQVTPEPFTRIDSNVNVGDGDLFVDTVSGRVGIGTNDPDYPLHVVGNVYVSDIAYLSSIERTTYSQQYSQSYNVNFDGITATDEELSLVQFEPSSASSPVQIQGDIDVDIISRRAQTYYQFGSQKLKISFNFHWDSRGNTGAWRAQRVCYDIIQGQTSGSQFINFPVTVHCKYKGDRGTDPEIPPKIQIYLKYSGSNFFGFFAVNGTYNTSFPSIYGISFPTSVFTTDGDTTDTTGILEVSRSSSGSVGIGTTNPEAKLSISSPNTNGATLQLRNKLTAAIEETASYAHTNIRQKPDINNNDRTLQFESYPYGAAGQNIMQWLAWNSSNDGWLTPMRLTSSGNLTISGTYSPSDDRLKTNEAYIENATETLLKLKPQKYDKHNYSFLEVTPETYSNSIDGNVFIEAANIWVDANTFTYSTTDNVWYKRTLSDVTHEEAGLIAQDIWYDTPELRYIVSIPNDAQIPETKPEVSDDPTIDPDYENWGRKNASVNYTYLIPYLIKSNQELHTELQTVKARLDTLENA
jgi:hypothetical protein